MKTSVTMKNTACTLLIFLVALTHIYSQAKLPKNSIGAKVLFIDYGNPNSIDDLDVTNGLELVYIRNLNRYINFAVPIKIGVANVADDINNRNIFGVDGVFQLQYFQDSSWFIPYIFGGFGYVSERDGPSNTQIPLGVGFNIKVGKNAFINLQGEYRISQEDNRNNIQYGAGFLYRFGKSDIDGDGIADSVDECPNIPGLSASNGCPDRDGDGIVDADDLCPDQPGRVNTRGCPDKDRDGITDADDECPETPGIINGCPDGDGDGIADNKDDCPEVFGVASAKGCPDRDGDGVADAEDKCPDEPGDVEKMGCTILDADGDGIADELDDCPDQAGTAATRGCPDTDTDGFSDKVDKCPEIPGGFEGCPDSDKDGVHDGDDRCPNEVGLATNKGCPEVEKEVKAVLDFAMRAVQFETGKAALKQESFAILDQIVDIMNRYKSYKLNIAGHTDSVGEESSNQVLSEERAKSCYQFLVASGVPPNRLSFVGYGETKPVADNNTPAGRRLNRRVEFNMILE